MVRHALKILHNYFGRLCIKELKAYHQQGDEKLVDLFLDKIRTGCVVSLHKKRIFPLRISSVNVTKLVKFTEEILNGKLQCLFIAQNLKNFECLRAHSRV